MIDGRPDTWGTRGARGLGAPLATDQLVQEGERRFTYVYDYGDNWRLSIVLEAMYSRHSGGCYPCLDGGARDNCSISHDSDGC